MSAIEHLLPWTQQPQEAVDLDPRWGLKPALVFAPSIDAGWVYGSSLSRSAGQQGRSVVLPGGTQTSANVATQSGGVTTAQTKCTFVCVASLTSKSPYSTLAGLKYSASSQGLYLGDTGGAGNEVGIIKGGVAALSYVRLNYGATYVIVASHRQDTGEYYILARDVATNQVLRNSQTNTQASTAGNGTYCVGAARSDGVTGSLAGDIYLSFGSFDWLPESSGIQLLANPWQLFEPRRIWVPVAAGGGGSWSVSLTETASANDSLGAATTSLVSLIESASAADIITAATIAAVALTEAASASDTQTASYSATGSGSVTESASASDALTAANTMLLSLTEAASASDTQTASYSVTGSGSVTESASATDTLDAATTMLRALTETASADDQLAAATTMLRAISESASAVDTPAASYSGAGTATIEELTSATDALTAAATLLVTILEAGSATDALAAATTMVRAITEQATAVDEVTASLPGSTWDVSIEELAAAVDLLAGYAAGGLTVSPLGLRLSAGGRSARLSTTARAPRLSTRTR